MLIIVSKKLKKWNAQEIMYKEKIKMKNKNLALIIKSIDLIFIVLVLAFLVNDLISILISLINTIYNYSNAQDIIYNISTSNVNTSTSHNTDVRVIHDDGT